LAVDEVSRLYKVFSRESLTLAGTVASPPVTLSARALTVSILNDIYYELGAIDGKRRDPKGLIG
jgi:hypothetical protein